jgi:two-component system chemotaxis sensor kinase CheA
MDVVRSAVNKINGSVQIESDLGKGTTIRISLPLSMAVTQVMIVESDGQLFGVPMDHVVETVRIPRSAIRWIKQSMTAVLRGRIVPLKNLNELLGVSAPPRANGDDELAVLLVHSGRRDIGPAGRHIQGDPWADSKASRRRSIRPVGLFRFGPFGRRIGAHDSQFREIV